MSKKDIVYHIGVDMSANIADVEAKFSKLKSSLSGLKLPATATKDLNETFTKASQELEDFIALASKSGHTEKDVQKLNAAYDKMSSTIDSLSRKMAGIEALDVKQLLPKGLRTEVEKISSDIKKLMDLSQGVDNSEQIKKATEAYTAQEKVLNQIDERVAHLTEVHSIQEKQQGAATAKVKELEKSYENAAEKQARLKEASQDFDADSYKSSKERTSQHRTSLAEKRARLEALGANDESSGKIAEARTTFRQKKEIDDSYSDKEKEAGAPNKSTKRIEAGQAAEKAEAKLNALLEERVQLLKDIKELEAKEGEIAAEESKQKTYEEWQEAEDAARSYSDEIDKARTAQKGASGDLAKTASSLASATSDQNKAKDSLDKLGAELKELKDVAGDTDPQLTKIRTALAELKGVSLDDIPTDFVQLQTILDNLVNDEVARTKQSLQDMRSSLDGAAGASDGLGQRLKKDFNGAVQSITEAQRQMDQLSQSMLHFFSLTNGWQLLKRAIREAFKTVKELDAAMTEIAVVSDYTVDEIWAMREQYSVAATQMGAKTIDLVNATKLYVQQGLSLNEAMEVGIETTKMARIANLDGAEATNLMTAALRGFNMEMEEANRVNDTYSQLAAKSAADTQEIAVAMSKTASIAANAGSSFENMSAFLTQIIETTREAPETAGTAMKTIIARFQELKKPMSEIGEVDGEIVDANGIETALRSAGVQLRDTNGEFRDFDEVIIELAGKWDSLDVMTQRYIATMAAGSRQQSRFIALMSDNARLTELVSYANNSAGAANAQYEKTLESLEAKLNKLKNAIDIFWTNLANNEIIKGVVDLLTKLIETVNSLTSVFTQSENGFMNFIGSLLQIGMVAGAFKLQQNAILGIFSKISAASFGAGKKAGEQYSAGFNTGLNKMDSGKGLKNFFAKFMGKQKKQQGPAIITPAQMKTVKTYDANMKALNTTVVRYSVNSKQAANMTNIANASQNKMSQALGLNTTQMQTYNSLRAAGVSVDGAAALVMGALSKEEEEAIVRQGLLNGLSQDEIKQKLGEAAATKMALMADQQENNVKKTNLATRQKLLIQKLLGIEATVTEDGVTRVLTWAELKDAIAKKMQALAQWKVNIATYSFPGLWLIAIILAIVAVVAVLVVAIMSLCGAFDKTESEAERMRQLEKRTEAMKKAQDEAKQAYDDLVSSINELGEKRGKLDELVRGTTEWRNALLESNKAVLDLVTEMPELAQYMEKGVYGELVISDEGLQMAQAESFQKVQRTQAGYYGAQATLSAAKQENIERRFFDTMFDEMNAFTRVKDKFTGNDENNLSQEQVNQVYKQLKESYGISVGYQAVGQQLDFTIYSDLMDPIQEVLQNLAGSGDYDSIEEFAEKLKEMGIEIEGTSELLHESAALNQQTQLLAQQAMMGYLDTKHQDYEYADEVASMYSKFMTSEEYKKKLDGASDEYLGDNYGGGSENDTTSELKDVGKKYGLTDDSYTGAAKDDVFKVYEQIFGEGSSEGLTGKEQARGIYAHEMEERYGKSMNAMIDKMKSMDPEKQRTLASFMSNETDLFTLEEAQTITTDEQLQGLADALGYKTIKELAKGLGTTEGELRDVFEDKAQLMQDEAKETQAILDNYVNEIATDVMKGLSLPAASALQKTLEKAKTQGGTENASEIASLWADITAGMIDDIRAAATTAFSYLDFTNLGSFYDFKKTLANLDANIPTDKLEELYETMKQMGAITAMTDAEFKSMIQNIASVFDELQEGTADAIYTAEEYAAITKAIPDAAEDFVMNLHGEYVYIGSRMSELRDAINENTNAILQENIEVLEKKIKIGNAQEGISVKDKEGNHINFKSDSFTNEQQSLLLAEFFKANPNIDLSQIGYGDIHAGNYTSVDSVNLVKAISGVSGDNLPGLINSYAKYQRENKVLNLQRLEATDLSLLRSAGADEENGGLTKDALLARAATAGISDTLLQQYREAFETNSPMLEALEKQIIDQMNQIDTNTSFSNLIDSINEVKEEYDGLLDVELKVAKVQSIFDDFGIKVNKDNVDRLMDLADAIANGDYNAYLQAVRESMGGGGYDTNFSLGANGVIKTQKQTLSDNDKSWLNQMNATNQLDMEEKTFSESDIGKVARIVTTSNGTAVSEWQIITKEMVGKQGSIANAQGLDTFKTAAKDAEQWENSYDWLYNLQKRMNKELRERNKLETEENRILEDRGSVSEILDNLGAQTRSILQSQSQNDLLKEKRMEEKALWEKDVKKHGLQNYMWMTEDGVMQINYDKINSVKGTAQGETIEKFLSEGEFLQDEFETIEDNQEENTDALREIKRKYFEDAVTLEEEIIDALYTLREREIDRLSDINEAITDGNEEMINRISDQISDMRTAREEQESLDNINEMEQRLALMRTDTSGANALDILSLEKDLEQARQDFQDSQVDRAIEEMTKQNEEAAEQRQKQIDLMREQLDADRDYGQLAKQADQLMLQEMQGGGSESIKKLLTEVGDEDSLGRYGQIDFENALNEKITKGIVGAIKAGAPEEGETITFEDQTGTPRTGVALADGSVLSEGLVYKDVFSTGELDANGKPIYTQRKDAQIISKDTWDEETKIKASTLKIGKADQVQVTGTTVNVNGRSQDKAFSGSAIEDVAKAIKNSGNTKLAQKITDVGTWTEVQKDKFLAATGYSSWNELGYAYVNKKITGSSIQSAYDTVNANRFSGTTAEAVAKYLDKRFGGTYGATIRQVGEATKEQQTQFLAQFGVSDWTALGNKIGDDQIQPVDILKKYFSVIRGAGNGGSGGGRGRGNRGGAFNPSGPNSQFVRQVYATGGLADFTGPAWLDGTKSRPEYVLNAVQTQGFLSLVDILDNFDADKTKKGSGDNYYDVHIEVDEISNDYDVEQLMDKMKRIIADDAMYRNVNAVDLGRR